MAKNKTKTLSMYDAKHFIWEVTRRKILYDATVNLNKQIYSDTAISMEFIRDAHRGIRDQIVKDFKAHPNQLRNPSRAVTARIIESDTVEDLIRRLS